MERGELTTTLHRATAQACDFARRFVIEPLPGRIRFVVQLNQSCDDAAPRADERRYPEDSAWPCQRVLVECHEDAVVEALWRDGRVPEWVNLTVIGEATGAGRRSA